MTQKGEITAIVCSIICITIFQAGLFIPSLYFAYEGENATCQEGTRGGINLSDWNKIFGFEKVGLNVALFLSVPLVVYGSEIFLVVPGVALFLDFFFNIAWWIWGVVVLATRENNHCVSEGKGMAVMAIIDLALGVIWFSHTRVALAISERKD